MTRSKCAIALIAAASVLAFAGTGLAANPTQADFDACNKEAQAKGGSPAASPGTSGTPSASPSSPGTSSTPSASPSSPGTSSTPSATPSTSGGSAGTTSGASSTTGGSSASGGASSSADLQGMASAGQADPAYQQAYRDCLKRRGF